MLGKTKESISPSRVDTIIGKETSFKGNIEAPGGSVRIDGNFEGELHIGGDLIIGETGNVVGILIAKNIVVAGEVKGTLEARGKLELTPTAKVTGDTKMAILIVEDGAFLQGQCAPMPRGELKERGKALQVGQDTDGSVAAKIR